MSPSHRRKLIVGNWKMNGSVAANRALLEALVAGVSSSRCDVVVCPPAVYLGQARELCAASPIQLGAQDASAHAEGAYTGEISAAMLAEMGARFCIVGHSERRRYHGESDLTVARKAERALEAGLTPIVCVGETLDEREQGLTGYVVRRQLDAAIEIVGARLADLVLAYEPVWAIGTGKTATPEQAQQVHAGLRAQLRAADSAAANVRVLYGGSMNAGNAVDLLAQPDVDGGLIGGAALKAPDFLQIVAAAG